MKLPSDDIIGKKREKEKRKAWRDGCFLGKPPFGDVIARSLKCEEVNSWKGGGLETKQSG